MSGVADRFAEEAPGVESATSVQHGEYVHEYRGTVATVDERVRLFVLAPRIDDGAVHDAFRRAARQWHSPSTHPNIVTVHSRETTPRPWIATADPGATSLASDAPLSVPAVRETIEDVAEAVRNAHLYSTTHLDLTPDDIWLKNAEDDRTALVDNWGLERACRVAAGETPLSPFTAPELVADPAGGTEQTDVYGLGAVAYYALTGRAPVSDTEELESAIEAGPETPPGAVDSTLPGQIDSVVMTALSSDPAVRHESAYGFRTAVTAALPDRSDRSVDSDVRRDTDTQTRDHQSSTDTGQASETGAPSGTATQAETTPSNDDRSRLTRRRVVLAIGGIALSSVGWLRFRSGADRDPGPGVASTATPTPTPTPAPTPTATVTETTAQPDSPTPTENAASDSTETPTETPVSTDGVSMFRYDPANTGTRSDPTGPTSYMVEQWTFRVGREVISSPTVVDETVYVGANNGTVYALDATDGTEKWQSETGNRVRSSPAVTDETVYVGSDDGTLYALDATEGFKKWSHQTGGAVFSSPAVVNGSVYVGSNDRQIYALDAADGTEEWSFETNDRVRSSPAVVDGTTYVGSDDGNLYALDAADGTRDWRFETTATIYSSPSVVDETVYVGTHNTSLYAVGSEHGIEQWSFQGGGRIFSSPAVANGTVCVGSGSRVYGVDVSDGSEEWSFGVNGTVRSSPAIADRTVYVGSDKSALAAGNNTVYGIDTQDGTRETAFETFGDVRSSPAVTNNTLYVGSGDGNVYGLTEN